MASSLTTGKAGVINAPDDAGNMDKLSHAVLDDLLYNIVHDLLIKVHRDEKIARAATAAIRVEKLAADASDSATDARPDVKVETDAAIYDDGKVLLKGNPLVTTKDIVCPRCHLPRLLYPTDGKGARKPDPSIIYCKKRPYIEKPGFDIYGQTWITPGGPGRGKKKKDLEKKADSNTPADTPTSASEGANAGGNTATTASRPAHVLSFPSATCSKCKRCILVTRLNNHMGSCIGHSGRSASRVAAQKISNGGSNGNGDGTPPSSQKGTPLPGSRASSPKKRDGNEMDEDDATDNDAHKKKKLKPMAASVNVNKKLIVKPKFGGVRKDKKLHDDDGPTVEVAPKKKITKVPSPAKKFKLGGKPLMSSPLAKSNGKATASSGNPGDDAASESSGTLSSPPAA